MPSKSKSKGNAYEREIVKDAQARGYMAERAWGSNGESKGWHAEVDVQVFVPRLPEIVRMRHGKQMKLTTRFDIQAKRRKAIPAYLKPTSDVDVVFTRGDREKSYVVMPVELFYQMAEQYDPTVND